MAPPAFRELELARDREVLTGLLTSEVWSFRTRPRISRAEVDEEIAGGAYSGADDLTLLIEEGETVLVLPGSEILSRIARRSLH